MGDEFNGTIYFMIRGSNMAAKQEVASITTYIYPSRLIFLYRFEWVTSSMAPFISYFRDSIWLMILLQINYSFVYDEFNGATYFMIRGSNMAAKQEVIDYNLYLCKLSNGF